MNAKTQKQPDVVDATAQTVEDRLTDVEDYATRIDEALGTLIDRVEALEKGSKAVSGKSDKGLHARIEALEKHAEKHPHPETDSMGLPKVV